jgi:hypothetical protein
VREVEQDEALGARGLRQGHATESQRNGCRDSKSEGSEERSPLELLLLAFVERVKKIH